VAEVTYDPVEVLAQFSARRKIVYTLLSDPKSKIIGAFGLIDEAVPRDSDWYGFAHPLIFVIDTKGVVRHRFSDTNYQVPPDPDMIFTILWKESTG